ncbi:alpha/beta fold hydrolase [Anabaena sp. FACHB-1237]|nr:alpha/beta fold hydrolase [Anabaena sp. FACHB-1237]
MNHLLQQLSDLLLNIGIFIVIGYGGICIFLLMRQRWFIFFPSRVIEKTPAELNLPYQDVRLPVTSKLGKTEKIHGWWMKSSKQNAPVLLYLHGNGLNISANINHSKRFYELGFSVLLIDYRGYGWSDGNFPREKSVYEDAMTGWNFLVKTQNILPENIIIYGHSLGGAIAIDLAIKQPKAAGVIVESSFTSILEMVTIQKRFSLFPVKLLLNQKFASIDKLPKLKIPILFIHGTADSTVPSFMSEKLYAVAPTPKSLILAPGADHNNIATTVGLEYLKWIQSFINQHLLVKYSREKGTENRE